MKKIFISAGDPSGDIHAARLMNKLSELLGEIEFVGIGGDKMIEAGLNPIIPLEEVSVVGFWEVAKKAWLFWNLLQDAKLILKLGEFDAFIPVDYPGFNLKLCTYAKSINIPVLYYIAPQLWAWGKDRAKNLSSSVDKLYVVFPFEVEYFKNFGINAEFIGHPLLDNDTFSDNIKTYDERDNLIALLPGSRKQEIIKNLPIFQEAALILKNKYPEYKFGIATAKTVDKSYYDKYLIDNSWSFWDDSIELMKSAKAGIVKTGTSNLEAALCGMPFSMAYRTSLISYMMGKKLVNLPYISIVNILSNKFLINEFIQSDANGNQIFLDLDSILSDKEKYSSIQNDFNLIKRQLGTSGASERAASSIVNYMENK